MSNNRSFFIDNLKGLLILCVVIGHFISYADTNDCHLAQTISNFIYTFHMPLFLFCSGLFVKRSFAPHKKGQVTNILTFFVLYLIFQFITYCIKLTAGTTPNINLMNLTGGSWYLFTLVCFLLVAPIFMYLRFIPAFLISIALSVMNAVYNTEPTFLSSSRFFTYLPWFILGFYLTGENFEQLKISLEKSTFRKWGLFFLASTLLLAYFMWLYVMPKDLLVIIRHMATGMHSYPNLQEFLGFTGKRAIILMMIFRVVHYLLIASISFSVIVICPVKKNVFLTVWGQRSLQIYIIHLLYLYWYKLHGIDEILKATLNISYHTWAVFYPLIADFILTTFLSIFPWPNQWISKFKSFLNQYICI